MTLFEFMVVIIPIIFIILGIDLYRRGRANLLHIIVFLVGGIAILLFGVNNDLLNQFGSFFGIARGADLIVYISIILLFYFYFALLNQHIKNKYQLSKFISQQSIYDSYRQNKENIKAYQNKEIKDQFCFIIRVYNEAKVLEKVTKEIIANGFHKIIFVNDGSIDNSLDILQNIKTKNQKSLIIIINHHINRGGGAANKTLFNFVKQYGDALQSNYFVTYDADGQMDIKDMDKFISEIKKEENKDIDLYLGSRFISGSKTQNMPLARKMILKLSRLITLVFYNTKTTDPHNGYRILCLETIQKINLESDGMHYANEIQEQIRKNRLIYKEVPTRISYTDHSLGKQHAQKNSHSIRMGLEIIYKKFFFR